MNRRAGICAIAACLLSAPPAGQGAPAARVHRIGVLCPIWDNVSYFWAQLQALGYEEHRNVEFVFRDIDTSRDWDLFAGRLVAAKVDVIVTCTNDGAAAAKRATSSVPIVLLYGVVPVELGLVASLARPGANVTGSAAIPLEMASKSAELFRSALPRSRRFSVIVDRTDPVGRILLAETQRAARELGITIDVLAVHDEADLAKAFAELERDRPDGIIASISVITYFGHIIDFAAEHRLPAMYPVAPAVTNGGLMAYSPNWVPQSEKNALIVDRILKGANPRDIPVEQPAQYAFSINLQTARRIGLTIPPSVLLRATRVIE